MNPVSLDASPLAALNELARQAAGHDTPAPTDSNAFGNALTQAIRDVSSAQNTAYAETQAYSAGTSDMPLNRVMIDLQKANIGFQTLMQVRNKVVTAYQTISAMPM